MMASHTALFQRRWTMMKFLSATWHMALHELLFPALELVMAELSPRAAAAATALACCKIYHPVTGAHSLDSMGAHRNLLGCDHILII